MAVIKDDRMPCSITDGPQEDDAWVDDMQEAWLDLSPFVYWGDVVAQIPNERIFDFFVDALIDELGARNQEEFKRILECEVEIIRAGNSYGLSQQYSHAIVRMEKTATYVLGKAFERTAKEMMKSESIMREVYGN